MTKITYVDAQGTARSVEASDGSEWFGAWNSDSDGLPHLVRVTVTARSDDGTGVATFRRVVAVDRVPIPPVPMEEESGSGGQPSGDQSGTGGSTGTNPGTAPTGGGGNTGGGNTGGGNTGGGGRPGGTPAGGGAGTGGGSGQPTTGGGGGGGRP